MDFNETISTTSVRRKQSKIHSTVIQLINNALIPHFSANDDFEVFLDSLASPVDSPLSLLELHDPDLQLAYIAPDTGLYETIFAVELGFCQPSQDLEDCARALIRDTSVKTCLLVDIKERPYYKNPFRLESLEKSIANLQTCKSQLETTSLERSVCLEDGDNPYSPVQVLGLRWVGELTATVQVFGKDPETGEAVPKTKRMVSYAIPPSFSLGRHLVLIFTSKPNSYSTAAKRQSIITGISD